MEKSIKIGIDEFEDDAFPETEFSPAHAFLALAAGATRGSWKVNFDGEQITLIRGQIITSTIKLAKEWGWTRDRVRWFIQKLVEKNRIVIEKSSIVRKQATLITIVNYDRYDFSESPKKELSDWQMDVSVVNRRLKRIQHLEGGDGAFAAMLIKQHGFLMVVAKLEQISASEQNFNFKDAKHAKAYVLAALKKIAVDTNGTKTVANTGKRYDTSNPYEGWPTGDDIARERGLA